MHCMQHYEQKYLNIVGKNIKKFRENRGFSQEKLAEEVECSREFINRVERRKEDISLRMLLRLSYILEIPPESFFQDI